MGFTPWLHKRWGVILFLVCSLQASIVVAFYSGFLAAESRDPLYYKVRAAIEAAIEKFSLQLAQLIFSEKCDRYRFIWFATREKTPGVMIHQANKICPGLSISPERRCASVAPGAWCDYRFR